MKLLVSLFAFYLSCFGSPAAAQDWSQFGGPAGNFQVAQALSELEPDRRFAAKWECELGAGMSGVVAAKDTLYTAYLQPFEAEQQTKDTLETQREVIAAIDRTTGQARWKHVYQAGWLDEQETFGGRLRAPQATPAIVGDYLVSLGFTGRLHCLDRHSGVVIWKLDLVDRFAAVPVQFGFSASPIPYGDSVIVLAGGMQGGLVRLRIRDGSVMWNVPCNEASYATPVLWQRQEGDQLVFVTRDDIIGVSADQGQELWRYPLPKTGLTNVPTPLPISDDGLLVSGQGIGGTRRLQVALQTGAWSASEAWFNRRQFFYCNWLERNGVLWGCDGDLLVSLDVATGQTLGRWRGFRDSNLVADKRHLFILDGEGSLNSLAFLADQLQALGKYRLMDQRCWTAPTLSGQDLYCRGGDKLICIDLSGAAESRPLVSENIRVASLELKPSGAAEVRPAASPLERIVEAFEAQGLEAAWDLYNKIRDSEPQSLTVEQRRELVRSAAEQNLDDIVQQLIEHAVSDFPDNDEVRKMKQEIERVTADSD